MNTTKDVKIRYYLGSKLPKYIAQRAMVRFAKANNMFFPDRYYGWNPLSKTLNVMGEGFDPKLI